MYYVVCISYTLYANMCILINVPLSLRYGISHCYIMGRVLVVFIITLVIINDFFKFCRLIGHLNLLVRLTILFPITFLHGVRHKHNI